MKINNKLYKKEHKIDIESEEIFIIFNSKLQELMERYKIEQVDIAKRSSLPPATISRFYTGKIKVPDLKSLKKLSKAFNLPIDYFVNPEFDDSKVVIYKMLSEMSESEMKVISDFILSFRNQSYIRERESKGVVKSASELFPEFHPKDRKPLLTPDEIKDIYKKAKADKKINNWDQFAEKIGYDSRQGLTYAMEHGIKQDVSDKIREVYGKYLSGGI